MKNTLFYPSHFEYKLFIDEYFDAILIHGLRGRKITTSPHAH